MSAFAAGRLAARSGPQTQLAAVLAMAEGGVIGCDGDLPWRLGTDLKRFKTLTMGGTLIMGRRTYDSIGRPLPGRRTIVVSRNPGWSADGVEVAQNPQQALSIASAIRDDAGGRPFVVGGAEIYRQLLPKCAMVYLTRVLARVEGDTILTFDLSGFEAVSTTRFPESPRDQYPTELVELVRDDLVHLWKPG